MKKISFLFGVIAMLCIGIAFLAVILNLIIGFSSLIFKGINMTKIDSLMWPTVYVCLFAFFVFLAISILIDRKIFKRGRSVKKITYALETIQIILLLLLGTLVLFGYVLEVSDYREILIKVGIKNDSMFYVVVCGLLVVITLFVGYILEKIDKDS